MLLFNYSWESLGNIQIHGTGCESRFADAYNFACTLPQNKRTIIFYTCSFIEDRHIEDTIILKLLAKAFPEYEIYVTGCDVSFNKDCYTRYGNTYTNNEIDKYTVNRGLNTSFRVQKGSDNINIKIQDGCNFRCSYCAMNQYYLNPTSVPYDHILMMIKEQMITRPNYDRVILCGTEIASYYDEKYGYNLSDMIQQLVKDIPNIKLLLTAIDPASKEAEKIIEIIGKDKKHFIPYILLGVQSGSDVILRAMKRRHNVEKVRQLHKLAQLYNVTVGWDLIVGFPGETEELFNVTLDLLKELKPIMFDVFEYSDRKGTPSYNMPNKIPEDVKHKRAEIAKDAIRNYGSQALRDYYNGDAAIEQLNGLKSQALKYMEEGKELYLDIFNEDDVIYWIRHKPDKVIHVKYNMEKELESGIIIYFIIGYLKDVPVIIHVPKGFKDKVNVKEMGYLFGGIIQEDENEII